MYAFDLAVLDIAGTTVQEHGAVYVALADAVRAAGADPGPDELTRWMGADKTEAIVGLLGPGRADARTVGKTYDDFTARLEAAYEATPPTPLAGVPDALAELRGNGVQVALTTGFSRDVADRLLTTLGWLQGVVDAVVCAEDVGCGRPAPYMIFEAMRRTGVQDVRRVLVAGDTALDLMAGTNAGAGAVVGVLSGAMDAQELGAVRHSHLLPGIADLPALMLT